MFPDASFIRSASVLATSNQFREEERAIVVAAQSDVIDPLHLAHGQAGDHVRLRPEASS